MARLCPQPRAQGKHKNKEFLNALRGDAQRDYRYGCRQVLTDAPDAAALLEIETPAAGDGLAAEPAIIK